MKTLFDKVWDNHVVAQEKTRPCLCRRCPSSTKAQRISDTGHLHERGLTVAHPEKIFAFSDHYIPDRSAGASAGIPHHPRSGNTQMVELLIRNTTSIKAPGSVGRRAAGHSPCRRTRARPQPTRHGAGRRGTAHFDTWRIRQYSFGIGSSETTHVVATQTIWQRRPRTLRITIDGALGFGVTAKDIILAIIAKIGSAARWACHRICRLHGQPDVDERADNDVNMSIEAGGDAGMIAPDDTTYEFLAGRPFAPKGKAWDGP